MKFKVNRNFIVRSEEFVELNPKDFISCSNIEELNNEIEERLYNCEHPTVKGILESEQIGVTYYDYCPFEDNKKSFYLEWQKLKGLPEEL